MAIRSWGGHLDQPALQPRTQEAVDDARAQAPGEAPGPPPGGLGAHGAWLGGRGTIVDVDGAPQRLQFVVHPRLDDVPHVLRVRAARGEAPETEAVGGLVEP